MRAPLSAAWSRWAGGRGQVGGRGGGRSICSNKIAHINCTCLKAGPLCGWDLPRLQHQKLRRVIEFNCLCAKGGTPRIETVHSIEFQKLRSPGAPSLFFREKGRELACAPSRKLPADCAVVAHVLLLRVHPAPLNGICVFVEVVQMIQMDHAALLRHQSVLLRVAVPLECDAFNGRNRLDHLRQQCAFHYLQLRTRADLRVSRSPGPALGPNVPPDRVPMQAPVHGNLARQR